MTTSSPFYLSLSIAVRKNECIKVFADVLIPESLHVGVDGGGEGGGESQGVGVHEALTVPVEDQSEHSIKRVDQSENSIKTIDQSENSIKTIDQSEAGTSPVEDCPLRPPGRPRHQLPGLAAGHRQPPQPNHHNCR